MADSPPSSIPHGLLQGSLVIHWNPSNPPSLVFQLPKGFLFVDLMIPPIIGPIQDKIRYAYENLHKFGGLIQFWAPVKTGGRQLLTTCYQPFALAKLENIPYRGLDEYRSCSLKYQYNVDVNSLQVEDDPMIISGAPATAFRNQLPEILLDLRFHVTSPLVGFALGCGLMYSVILPVFDPSQTDCVGVVECSTSSCGKLVQVFNDLNAALEKQGLKTFDARKRLPYKAMCGLQNAKDEIDEALKTIWLKHYIPFAQVWIAFEDKCHVAFSSSSEGTQAKRMIGLKLTGHNCVTLDDENYDLLEDYGNACYRIPLKMDQGFAGKTLENYEPHFIQKNLKLSDNKPQRLLSICFDCSCFVIYLRSTKTGDVDYVFQFLWTEHGNIILLESLLLTLKRCLSSFKFASGAQLDDEIDIIDIENSVEKEIKYFKIFQRNKISLKRGRQSEVEECLMPLKAKGKTTPVILSREQIESQFGQTLEEAAQKLNVSVSTLKRKCKDKGIRWHGKDKGGAIQFQDNIRETSLNEKMVTIKAEYAGDVIKFTLPISSATFEAIEKAIGKRFKLDPAAHYQLKYFDEEDNQWILLTCDEDVAFCTKNKQNVQLRLLPRDPSHAYAC